jgi:ABC-type transporter Mla subunit MlaD
VPTLTIQVSTRKASKQALPVSKGQERIVQDNAETEGLVAAITVLKNNVAKSQDIVNEIQAKLDHYSDNINDLTSQVRSLIKALQSSIPNINTMLSTTHTQCSESNRFDPKWSESFKSGA